MGTFALGHGNYQRVSPDLINILKTAAERMPDGWKVEAFSGYRPGGKGNHSSRWGAIDVKLTDPSGREVSDYFGSPHVKHSQSALNDWSINEQFAHIARGVQHELYPQYDAMFRWGGYFKTDTPGDTQHYDFMGGSSKIKGPQTAYWQGGTREGVLAGVSLGPRAAGVMLANAAGGGGAVASVTPPTQFAGGLLPSGKGLGSPVAAAAAAPVTPPVVARASYSGRDEAIRTAYAEDQFHPETTLDVIFNRSQDGRFPSDLKAVVSQKGPQFSAYGNPLYKSLKPTDPAYIALGEHLDKLQTGEIKPIDALYFATDKGIQRASFRGIAQKEQYQGTYDTETGGTGRHHFYGVTHPRTGSVLLQKFAGEAPAAAPAGASEQAPTHGHYAGAQLQDALLNSDWTTAKSIYEDAVANGTGDQLLQDLDGLETSAPQAAATIAKNLADVSAAQVPAETAQVSAPDVTGGVGLPGRGEPATAPPTVPPVQMSIPQARPAHGDLDPTTQRLVDDVTSHGLNPEGILKMVRDAYYRDKNGRPLPLIGGTSMSRESDSPVALSVVNERIGAVPGVSVGPSADMATDVTPEDTQPGNLGDSEIGRQIIAKLPAGENPFTSTKPAPVITRSPAASVPVVAPAAPLTPETSETLTRRQQQQQYGWAPTAADAVFPSGTENTGEGKFARAVLGGDTGEMREAYKNVWSPSTLTKIVSSFNEEQANAAKANLTANHAAIGMSPTAYSMFTKQAGPITPVTMVLPTPRPSGDTSISRPAEYVHPEDTPITSGAPSVITASPSHTWDEKGTRAPVATTHPWTASSDKPVARTAAPRSDLSSLEHAFTPASATEGDLALALAGASEPGLYNGEVGMPLSPTSIDKVAFTGLPEADPLVEAVAPVEIPKQVVRDTSLKSDKGKDQPGGGAIESRGGASGSSMFDSPFSSSLRASLAALDKAQMPHTDLATLAAIAGGSKGGGWTLPNYSSGSGGSSMAYHPNTGSHVGVSGNVVQTGTYYDSHGNEHSYEMG